jgi:hypothetical protein
MTRRSKALFQELLTSICENDEWFSVLDECDTFNMFDMVKNDNGKTVYFDLPWNHVPLAIDPYHNGRLCCLCQQPIKHVCIINSRLTNKNVIAGQCCIQKIRKDTEDGDLVLRGRNRTQADWFLRASKYGVRNAKQGDFILDMARKWNDLRIKAKGNAAQRHHFRLTFKQWQYMEAIGGRWKWPKRLRL